MQREKEKDDTWRNATTRHYYSMPTIITTINGSRIGCSSYHYANSRYLFEIRGKRERSRGQRANYSRARRRATQSTFYSEKYDNVLEILSEFRSYRETDRNGDR